MNGSGLPDYLDHMRQAATDALSFVEGMSKDDFIHDKRSQQAVVMSLIIIGEVAAKVMDRHAEFVGRFSGSALAKHARDAQPHRTRVFRDQSRCGVGHRAIRLAGIADTVGGHARRCDR
jgi:hypothetical protein